MKHKSKRVKKDKRGYIGYIAEDDVNTAYGSTPDDAYNEFTRNFDMHPWRMLGIISQTKSSVTADVIEEFDTDEDDD